MRLSTNTITDNHSPGKTHKMRSVLPTDIAEWERMRQVLWPASRSEHRREIEAYFLDQSRDIREAIMLVRDDDRLGGFLELNIRNYAEGSRAPQVPYVEGWFVDDDLRGQGHGRRLTEAAQMWAVRQGFDELASDAEATNAASIAAHTALGFRETDRIVCFLKRLR